MPRSRSHSRSKSKTKSRSRSTSREAPSRKSAAPKRRRSVQFEDDPLASRFVGDSECISLILDEGWYIVEHTSKHHRKLLEGPFTESELVDLRKHFQLQYRGGSSYSLEHIEATKSIDSRGVVRQKTRSREHSREKYEEEEEEGDEAEDDGDDAHVFAFDRRFGHIATEIQEIQAQCKRNANIKKDFIRMYNAELDDVDKASLVKDMKLEKQIKRPKRVPFDSYTYAINAIFGHHVYMAADYSKEAANRVYLSQATSIINSAVGVKFTAAGLKKAISIGRVSGKIFKHFQLLQKCFELAR